MKFVIDRKTWWRGQGSGGSRLLRSCDGMMCCIGSVCLQLGSKQEDIRDIGVVFDKGGHEVEFIN